MLYFLCTFLPLFTKDMSFSQEKSRMELLASVLYQTDQTLRKVISEHMKHAKGTSPAYLK